MKRSILARPALLARLPLAAALLIATAARADEARPLLLALDKGEISYTVVHKLHQVTGTTRKLEGLARLQPGAPTLVQVRAPVASFDSGNSNRDAHMREATREPLHPFAEVKGTLPPLTLPLSGPQDLTLDARVELNGESERQTIPVTLTPEGSGIRAKFSFPVSLDAHKVERPELLLVKVDDKMTIEGNLLFEARQ